MALSEQDPVVWVARHPAEPRDLGLPTAQHGQKAGAVPTGKVQMCVARVCKRCGHTTLYSVVALNLDSMM